MGFKQAVQSQNKLPSQCFIPLPQGAVIRVPPDLHLVGTQILTQIVGLRVERAGEKIENSTGGEGADQGCETKYKRLNKNVSTLVSEKLKAIQNKIKQDKKNPVT